MSERSDERASRCSRSRNPWFGASVGVTAAMRVATAFAGLIWLPLAQPDLSSRGIWDAICSAAGVPRAASQAKSIQPDFKTSDVVMTSEMLTQAQPGLDRPRRDARATLRDLPRAAGVSDANSPNLAGQFAAVTYKELNDFKTGARVNAVMIPFAANLSNQDMVDIAAYYSYLPRVPSNKLDPKLARAADRRRRARRCATSLPAAPAMATSTPRPAARGSAASPRSISRRSCRRLLPAPAATTSASRCATSPGR